MRSRNSSVDIVMAGTFAAWRLGTLQARALPLARALRAHGVRTAIVTVPWDMPAESGVADTVSGVEIRNTRAARTATFPLAVIQQARQIHALQPGAIHVFKPKGYGGLSGRFLTPAMPLIVDSDDWEGDGGWNQAGHYSFQQRRLFAWQERDLLSRANAVTAASLLLARRAELLRSQRPVHVTWIPNGLDAAWAQQLAASRVGEARANADTSEVAIVLYSRFAEFPAGWLARYLRALSDRLPSDQRARLIIIGNTPDLGAGFPNLELYHMGYVALDRIPSLLSQAQIALFPYVDSLISRSKNSVKLLELMASGCAIVASNVGDIPAVAGDTAVLIDHDSPEAFAGPTLELARDQERMQRLSATAQCRAATNFNMHEIAGKLADAYRAVGVIPQ